MKVLNLYAGIGGNRKLWTDCDITAVEMDEETAKVYQDYFPNDEVIIGDAHQYLLDHYKEFDFIWSSPPCPTHSKIRLCGVHRGQTEAKFPDMKLYEEIVFLMYYPPKKTRWVVENVHGFYQPLIPYKKKVDRHVYWSNFTIPGYEIAKRYDAIRNNKSLMEEHLGFCISDYDLKNPLKSLRNCVDPEIGQYIFNCAKEIYYKSDTTQTALFTN